MIKIRKISALVLVIMMIAVAGSVFADGEAALETNGIVGDNTGTALSKSVIIYKELTGYNPDGSTVNAPNITYNYSIAPGTSDITITDKDGVVANTKSGVGEPTITNAVSWTSTETIATAATGSHDGTNNLKPITINFTNVNFEAAGVYRYVITESLPDGFAYDTSGVTNGDITNTRYLDVYVRDARDTETGRQIYGYVLFQNVPANHTANSETDSDVTAAVKTTGFVSDTDANDSTTLSADSYYTYNVTITKTLVNDSAMNSNKFPFSVTFANRNITKSIDIIGTADGTAEAADVANGSITSVAVSPAIAHGGSVVYTGIPVGTTVTVHETNNVTGTTYSSVGAITTAETGDTAADTKVIAPSVVSNDAVVASTTAGTAVSASKTIAFTNTLEVISPTGIVLRVAPYLLMLAAGIALVVILLAKRRRHTDED